MGNDRGSPERKSRPIIILLAEDNMDDIEIAERAFHKSRIETSLHVVHDGQAAVDYLFRQGIYRDIERFPFPDLILLDINMPKLTGFEVLDRIKADPVLKAIPTVMLTSCRNENDIVRSYRLGAASFIQKPVGYEEFAKIVEGFNLYWININKFPDLGPS